MSAPLPAMLRQLASLNNLGISEHIDIVLLSSYTRYAFGYPVLQTPDNGRFQASSIKALARHVLRCNQDRDEKHHNWEF